jgi:imidazolonepropionase-like amidohydrolase
MKIPIVSITAWLIGVLIIPESYLHGQTGPVKPDLALVGAKIYPSPDSPPIADGTVLIRDGKIFAVGTRRDIKVPPSDSVIDCKGLTLTAAFWNCHVHFINPSGRAPTGFRPASSISRWNR